MIREAGLSIQEHSPIIAEIDDAAEMEVSAKMGRPTFTAHWQLFVPMIVIALLYGIGLALLYGYGKSSTSLFRLFAIVLGVGVPLLAVQAFLRYQTVRLQFTKKTIRIQKGWPKDSPFEVPYELISQVIAKRGLAGRLFGGGTIILKLTTDTKIAIADLKSVDEIVQQFNKIKSA